MWHHIPPSQFYCHLDNLRKLSGPMDSRLSKLHVHPLSDQI
ncbi:hypothetical protein T07_7365 [Trichinella nelsoni]|uniref:Uncharacterized protein n=1 Tax=Trichinella nelsoni TaxID=6336 RepID=A0A0V0RB72_9BILA|nr:hypothetical protein T07_7365 [Trichinella nelsoni]